MTEPWWEQFGIDPDEPTASVEAGPLGVELANAFAQSLSRRMIDFLAVDVAPVARGFDREGQAEMVG